MSVWRMRTRRSCVLCIDENGARRAEMCAVVSMSRTRCRTGVEKGSQWSNKSINLTQSWLARSVKSIVETVAQVFSEMSSICSVHVCSFLAGPRVHVNRSGPVRLARACPTKQQTARHFLRAKRENPSSH